MHLRHLLAALCLLTFAWVGVACKTVTKQVIPHSRHAEKSVMEVVGEVSDGLAKTQRDLERILDPSGSQDRGRIFLHIHGSGIQSDLAVLLHQRMGGILEDAGYEIVRFEEVEEAIGRQSRGSTAQKAARSLRAIDGGGALDVFVTSVTSLGRGELNLEGNYEERLSIDVTTTFYEAKWGDQLFRDSATLTSKSVQRQGERYYSEKIHGMSTRERGIYRILPEHIRTLLPRIAVSRS
ncbi:MAG: hypothetical protein OXI87_10380 [Albidovulum sp.]|nr:hypothetical protein [Albidovulum sp.]MDE0305275.1 hypothetical protein [Albidovulum sp.]MDE0531147.1 hypothetical protein [Albidovulum sp.]